MKSCYASAATPPPGTARGSHLELFVMSDGELTRRTCENLAALRERLPDPLDVEIIDILKTPQRALESRVYITPTLVMQRGEETSRLIGDLSDYVSVIEFLGVSNV